MSPKSSHNSEAYKNLKRKLAPADNPSLKLIPLLVRFKVSERLPNQQPCAMLQTFVTSDTALSELRLAIKPQLRLAHPELAALRVSSLRVSSRNGDHYALPEFDFITASQVFSPAGPNEVSAILSPARQLPTPSAETAGVKDKTKPPPPEKKKGQRRATPTEEETKAMWVMCECLRRQGYDEMPLYRKSPKTEEYANAVKLLGGPRRSRAMMKIFMAARAKDGSAVARLNGEGKPPARPVVDGTKSPSPLSSSLSESSNSSPEELENVIDVGIKQFSQNLPPPQSAPDIRFDERLRIADQMPNDSSDSSSSSDSGESENETESRTKMRKKTEKPNEKAVEKPNEKPNGKVENPIEKAVKPKKKRKKETKPEKTERKDPKKKKQTKKLKNEKVVKTEHKKEKKHKKKIKK